MMPRFSRITAAVLLVLISSSARATASPSEAGAAAGPITFHFIGYLVVALFGLAYLLVTLEERIGLKKSVPVMIAAAVMWLLIAMGLAWYGDTATAGTALRHYILEYAELFLFLLTAMTYVNVMDERGVFERLRAWLIEKNFSLKQLFWITGALAFILSPFADNLTTALILGSVIMALGRNKEFVTVSCVNVVVAANAGGAFSPFGDITTLMVWQKGIVPFTGFLPLIFPALVNWLVPAFFMSQAIRGDGPERTAESGPLRPGGRTVVGLFFLTIATTVVLHSLLHIPPAIGMMAGLGLLKLFGFFLHRRETHELRSQSDEMDEAILDMPDEDEAFDISRQFERLEWDTLMFFYGIIMCVGALHTLGYLTLGSVILYGWGPTAANVLIGIASAVLDNIPLMYAVLSVRPDMSQAQWLLVTLTTGTGGSLLSIGSAAGVALMGLADGMYTFRSHLRWTWAIALGYVAAVFVHLLLH